MNKVNNAQISFRTCYTIHKNTQYMLFCKLHM